MADCKDTIRELEVFLDGELSPTLRAAISTHLAECFDCQGAFEFHHELRDIIRQKCQADEIAPDFLARLESCFEEDFDGDGRIG